MRLLCATLRIALDYAVAFTFNDFNYSVGEKKRRSASKSIWNCPVSVCEAKRNAWGYHVWKKNTLHQLVSCGGTHCSPAVQFHNERERDPRRSPIFGLQRPLRCIMSIIIYTTNTIYYYYFCTYFKSSSVCGIRIRAHMHSQRGEQSTCNVSVSRVRSTPSR